MTYLATLGGVILPAGQGLDVRLFRLWVNAGVFECQHTCERLGRTC
jgi:hypothetical protein